MRGSFQTLKGLEWLFAWMIVAGGYLAVCLIPYSIPFPSRLTPFWPGPAVALVAFCLCGWRILPGVMAGAGITALATGAPPVMAAAITVTSTLEAVFVWRVADIAAPRWWQLNRQSALVAFVVATILGSGLAAVLGCSALEYFAFLGGFNAQNLAVWWIGDGVGILIVAPLLLSLVRLPWRHWREFRIGELCLAVLCLTVLAALVFSNLPEDPVIRAILGYMAFPLLIWAILRFEIAGASLGMLVITLSALVGTALGYGPFTRGSVFDSVLLLQAYVAVMGITGLVLAIEVGLRRRTRARLRLSQERLDFALWGTDLGLWDWNFETGEIYFNEQWARLLGYRAEDLRSDFDSWANQIHPDDRERVRVLLEAHLSGSLPYFEADMRIRNSRGEWQWVQTRGKVVTRDEAGRPLRAAGTHRDIDASKRQEQALEHANAELKHIQEEREELLQELRQRSERFERRAREDHLTELPNRRHFEDMLEREWERARRFTRPLALAMADLDHFKAVNDEHSHQLGDRVLKRFARIVSDRLRQTDVVARYGGEEFVLVFPETDALEATKLCERLRQSIDDHEWGELADGVAVTCSFGIADNGEARSPEDVVSLADDRLYRAKRDGRNRVVGPGAAPESQALFDG